MTTDSRLSGFTILAGATVASFVAQFLPFQDGDDSKLVSVRDFSNRAKYTEVKLDLDPSGSGWDQHPNLWLLYAALAAAWLVPAIRDNENWRTFGPWVTAGALLYGSGGSAPFQASGAALALAAGLAAVWGVWRMRSERKSKELAAAEARKAAVSRDAW